MYIFGDFNKHWHQLKSWLCFENVLYYNYMKLTFIDLKVSFIGYKMRCTSHAHGKRFLKERLTVRALFTTKFLINLD